MGSFIDYATFTEKILALDSAFYVNYWCESEAKARWEYMSKVIDALKVLNPTTALELGTMRVSLMSFSDSLDKDSGAIDKDKTTLQYIIDATKLPWPIADKQYDVVVALQVLEHLGPDQNLVFNEMKRVAKSVILTLPYKWTHVRKDDCHYMVDDNKILEWTNNETPYKTLVIKNRIMLCYRW